MTIGEDAAGSVVQTALAVGLIGSSVGMDDHYALRSFRNRTAVIHASFCDILYFRTRFSARPEAFMSGFITDQKVSICSMLADIRGDLIPTGFHLVPAESQIGVRPDLVGAGAARSAVDRGFQSVEAMATEDVIDLAEGQAVMVDRQLVEVVVDSRAVATFRSVVHGLFYGERGEFG